ncbi:MAG TPA: asparagine synthase-related protein [Ardenticatenaceae bacterium]|jgi:asparagine synthase (glutamine-hydrolysing)
MSGLAGIIYTDGRPAGVKALLPATERMAFLGPDGVTTWAEGPAALAHLALHTTPEAEHEVWPLRDERGQTLVADARLDNRDELLHVLHPQRHAQRPITDAELILAAHERWGDAAPAHLLGDFAYALWNPVDHTLRLVRSPFGLKGLFYTIEAGRVLFASTLRGVQALSPRAALNLPWIASFLAGEQQHHSDQTVFTHVHKVPHAHLVRFQTDPPRETRQRFWDLAVTDAFRGWSDDDWTEAFRDHFDNAVAARLRSNAPVAVAVSGGLDSSSIALAAHRLMHDEARVPPLPVRAYTQRMPGWPNTDETPFQEAVYARLLEFEVNLLDVERAWNWQVVESCQRRMSTPSIFPNAFMSQPFYQHAAEHGCRVKLSGAGGDIITGGEDYFLLEALGSLGWRRGLREFPFFAQGGLRSYLRVGRRLLRDRLDSRLVHWWQRRRDPQLYTPKCEAAARKRRGSKPEGASPLQQLFYEKVMSAGGLQPFEQRAEILALHGLELRVPFYDRRLIELAFHTPPHLRFSQGRTRVLLKRALERDLPPLLVNRASKADFTRFTAYSILPEDHARAIHLPPESLLRRQEWIDSERWQQWATRPQRPSQTISIHRVAHLHHWLTTLT